MENKYQGGFLSLAKVGPKCWWPLRGFVKKQLKLVCKCIFCVSASSSKQQTIRFF